MFSIAEDEINDLSINNILPFYKNTNIYHNHELNVKLFRKYIAFSQSNFTLNNKNKGKILIFRDITEQKILSEIWHRYEYIVNTTKDLMVLIRKDLTFAIVNKAFSNAFNKDIKEFFNKHIADFWDEKIIDKIVEPFEKCFNGEIVTLKDWLSFGNIKERYFEITLYPYNNSEINVVNAILIMRDITELKQGEDQIQQANIALEKKVAQRTLELKESEERYKGIVDNIPILICRFKPETFIITFINDHLYCDYFGKKREELLGKSILDLAPKEQHKEISNSYKSLSLNNPIWVYEIELNTSSGLKWQRWTGQALFDKNGNITVYQSIGIDLTEKIKAELELKNANYKMLQLINSISSILISVSTDKVITHFNPTAEQVFNLKSEDVINKNLKI